MRRPREFLPVLTAFRLTFHCPACHADVEISNEGTPPSGCARCGRKYRVYLSIQMDTAGMKPVRS